VSKVIVKFAKLCQKWKCKVRELGLYRALVLGVGVLLSGYLSVRDRKIDAELKTKSAEQLVLIGNNKRLLINLNDEGLSRDLFLYGSREPIVSQELLRHFQEHKYGSFVDIGANIGYYSVYLSDFFEEIHCIEPVSDSYQLLRRNIELNGLSTRCSLYNCCVGSHNGKGRMLVSRSRNCSRLMHHGERQTSSAAATVEYVPIKRLASILDCQRLKGPVFVKMDVEGYEYEILKSHVDFLTCKTPTLFVEIHETLGPEKIRELLQILDSLGYVVLCAVADFTARDYTYRSIEYGRRIDRFFLRAIGYCHRLVWGTRRPEVVFRNCSIHEIINEWVVLNRWLEYVFVHPNCWDESE